MYYKEPFIGQHEWHLDEDYAEIEAVQQQLLAIQRLVQKMKPSSKDGKLWQTELAEGIGALLHDTATDHYIERGKYLIVMREPY
jgi:hypothetical protein